MAVDAPQTAPAIPAIVPPRQVSLVLPRAKDPSLTFYCVRLATWKGYRPAFLVDQMQTHLVANLRMPFDPSTPRRATNSEELRSMENPVRVTSKDADGADTLVTTRCFQDANEYCKDRRYFEDPRAAAMTDWAPVEAIGLWCLVREQDPASGSIGDHGRYQGILPNQKPIEEGIEPGVCPKCSRDPQRQHEYVATAMRAIRATHQRNNVPLLPDLARKIASGALA